MFRLLTFCSVVVCVYGAALPEGLFPQQEERIVGGNANNIANSAYQVSLQRNGRHFCGGSIYSTQIIVTAASCLNLAIVRNMQVRAGSSYWNTGGVLVQVNAFKIHEDYNPNTMEYDIAVLRLSRDLEIGHTIRPIVLANSPPRNDLSALVTGWGTQSENSQTIPDQLQYTFVSIISQFMCASSAYGYGSLIKDSMICASAVNKGFCQGDNGSPLACHGLLVGIASWHFGCALKNYPDVYTNVAVLHNWVVSSAESI